MQTASVFDIPHLRPSGRFHPESASRAGVLPLFWAASGLELTYTGQELHLILEADFEQCEPWIAVELDGAPVIRMPVSRGISEVCVFRGALPGTPRTVQMFKETQPVADDPRHRLAVCEIGWEGGEFLPLPRRDWRLEFVGDSLTSGEGVAGARAEESWMPAVFSASRTWARLTSDLMNASFRTISQSGWGVRSGWDNDPRHNLPELYERVCGAAVGEAAQERNDFSAWKPDAVIINLGTNDANALSSPAWTGPNGEQFRQTGTPEGLRQFEDAAVLFLKQLRRCNPDAKLVWAYGMCGGRLRPQLENAVERFRRETGGQDAYYLPLPENTAETMGSRQHPGVLCHQAAAEVTANFLKDILS
ncbi:MAG: GDSL family lipase [Oscillospiraceae bacterium]|nr:GDSL family lipase [Oscillospiraceae bacterium]